MSDPIHQPERGDERAARTERNWALLCTAIVAVLIAMAAYAGVHQATMPQVADRVGVSSGAFTEAPFKARPVILATLSVWVWLGRRGRAARRSGAPSTPARSHDLPPGRVGGAGR